MADNYAIKCKRCIVPLEVWKGTDQDNVTAILAGTQYIKVAVIN